MGDLRCYLAAPRYSTLEENEDLKGLHKVLSSESYKDISSAVLGQTNGPSSPGSGP